MSNCRTIAGLAWLLGLSLTLSALAAGVRAEPASGGDWLGSIKVSPAAELHLALHLKPAAGGGYAGTLDSLDQGAFAIPLADVVLNPDVLSFTAPSLHAAYEGAWRAETRTWAGRWTQGGGVFDLAFASGVAPNRPMIAGLDGDWDGTLEAVQGFKLRLVLHVKTKDGSTTATMDSIDQGAMGLGVSSLSRTGDTIKLQMALIGATFEGVLHGSGDRIAGHWRQGGGDTPLVLAKRAPGAPEVRLLRPQTPRGPYPYGVEDVRFDNPGASVVLAGTFTAPPGQGPFPAVVLVAGSGPNTRDEPLFGHRLFLVLADRLTRSGVAVLRYDKRGVGGSTGDYAASTTLDFAADASAAVAYLKTRKEVDPRRIGMIGHSEGGLIAPWVAAHDPSLAFIVMLAGPAVKGADVLSLQGRLLATAAGMAKSEVLSTDAWRDRMIQIVRTEPDPAVAAAKLKAAAASDAFAAKLPQSERDASIRALNTPWFRFFLNYDPAAALRQVQCPVLALYGSRDLQVPPSQNLPALRAALQADPDVEIDELPGLNHLFQTAATGGLAEYGAIQETIAPSALDLITRWVLRHAGQAKASRGDQAAVPAPAKTPTPQIRGVGDL